MQRVEPLDSEIRRCPDALQARACVSVCVRLCVFVNVFLQSVTAEQAAKGGGSLWVGFCCNMKSSLRIEANFGLWPVRMVKMCPPSCAVACRVWPQAAELRAGRGAEALVRRLRFFRRLLVKMRLEISSIVPHHLYLLTGGGQPQRIRADSPPPRAPQFPQDLSPGSWVIRAEDGQQSMEVTQGHRQGARHACGQKRAKL